jgi:hypothetical protein
LEATAVIPTEVIIEAGTEWDCQGLIQRNGLQGRNLCMKVSADDRNSHFLFCEVNRVDHWAWVLHVAGAIVWHLAYVLVCQLDVCLSTWCVLIKAI